MVTRAIRSTTHTVLAVVLVTAVLGVGFWLMAGRPTPADEGNRTVAPTDGVKPLPSSSVNFIRTGNVVRNGDALKPETWFLVYEAPGAPALTVELYLDSLTACFTGSQAEQCGGVLTQGRRVTVAGTRQNEVARVTTLWAAAAANSVVFLYYYNPSLDRDVDGNLQCSRRGLQAVPRPLPSSTDPLADTLALLLRGELRPEERALGLSTEFPLAGVQLLSASLADGTATLQFADPQNRTGGGSCRVAILWAQIEATAKQFPGVQRVQFFPQELFQP